MATQIDPTSSVPGKKTLVGRIKGSRFLVISILFHVVLFVVAGILVVQVITTKRKQTFSAVPPAPANRAVEHKVQMAKKQQSMSAPMTKRVVTTGLSKVALPEMPDISAQPDLANPMMANTSGAAPGLGLGTAMGSGDVGGTAGGNPFFGFKDNKGSSLVGTLYDLKQNRSRQPTGVKDIKTNVAAVKAIADSGFADSEFRKYFKARSVLYTPMIMMPSIRADEGPKAFGVERQVQPKSWVVLYQAKVTPPRSGTIHFVGGGDDVLIVSLDGKIVLDGGWKAPWSSWKTDTYYKYDSRRVKSGGGGYARGDGIKVEAGQWYDLKILIGEGPGGYFDSALLIQEDGVSYRKDAHGNPILPPFRLSNVKVGELKKGESIAPYAPSGPIWKTPAPPGAGGGLLPR